MSATSATGQQSAQILDKALELAEVKSWEKLRLHDIATELDISLDDIHQHYAQKDDLVEAWYDRADMAMLQYTQSQNWTTEDMPSRFSHIIMSWLDALSKHRKVSGDMLLYKIEPGHIHLQVLGVMRISRTVQWFLEAASSHTTHMVRIAEEIGLSSIFLATFVYWLKDDSPESSCTREFLERRLDEADSMAKVLFSLLPGTNSIS